MPPTSIQSVPPFASTSNSRLHALYSDISRQKRSNPTSYHANVNWWQRALESVVSSGAQHVQDAVHANGRVVLHAGRSLMDTLKVDGVGKPLGLGAVIDELRASKTFIPMSYFLDTKESIYDPGWLPTRIAAYVVGKPLWWTLEQLGIVGEDGFFTPGHRSQGSYDDKAWWGEYVIVSLVERAAESIIDRQHSKASSAADNLYDLEGFKAEFGTVLGLDILDDEDTRVMLKFLERDRSAIVMDNEVIKFVPQSTSMEERRVSTVDRGILELKTAITNMHAQIESLNSKMDEYTRKASEAIRLKRKAMALNYLRSRKLLEDLNNKRLTSLTTLESTLISVEAAAGDIEIMRMYESSTATLRAILAHPSLKRESIDKTLDALAEANADAKEIDDAVRIGADVALDTNEVDDEELETELNKLIEEATMESNEHRKVEERLGDAKMKVPREGFPGGSVEDGRAIVPSLA
ncbi:Snf7-domain-containing protein [Amanita rubescens]|nr:Snf7-domain-containing protein [Amanita rubescens]